MQWALEHFRGTTIEQCDIVNTIWNTQICCTTPRPTSCNVKLNVSFIGHAYGHPNYSITADPWQGGCAQIPELLEQGSLLQVWMNYPDKQDHFFIIHGADDQGLVRVYDPDPLYCDYPADCTWVYNGTGNNGTWSGAWALRG